MCLPMIMPKAPSATGTERAIWSAGMPVAADQPPPNMAGPHTSRTSSSPSPNGFANGVYSSVAARPKGKAHAHAGASLPASSAEPATVAAEMAPRVRPKSRLLTKPSASGCVPYCRRKAFLFSSRPRRRSCASLIILCERCHRISETTQTSGATRPVAAPVAPASRHGTPHEISVRCTTERRHKTAICLALPRVFHAALLGTRTGTCVRSVHVGGSFLPHSSIGPPSPAPSTSIHASSSSGHTVLGVWRWARCLSSISPTAARRAMTASPSLRSAASRSCGSLFAAPLRPRSSDGTPPSPRLLCPACCSGSPLGSEVASDPVGGASSFASRRAAASTTAFRRAVASRVAIQSIQPLRLAMRS
mmetsp:Transcript_37666/g.88659  ORF Transcript_37666/g.88659 Transcript_37666/m.88659 type:complete len:362 (-) Transcript_37666:276-1361(-)